MVFHPASARRGPAGSEHRRPRQPDAVGRHSAPQARISARHAAQRADGGAVGGSFDADRARAALVSRRLEEREAGPHRVRAPVRAPDVQGLEERSARRAHVDDFAAAAARATPTRPTTRRCSGRRCRRSICRSPCGSKPIGWRRCRIDKETFANERDVVKEERRLRVDNQPFGRLNEIIYDQAFTRAPLQAPDDRQHGGSRGGVGRRRARFLPDLLRAVERDAGASSATSTRRRRSRS